MIIYHGSKDIIEKPEFGKGNKKNVKHQTSCEEWCFLLYFEIGLNQTLNLCHSITSLAS